MLRVMLVDDEPLALEGLKLLINWQAEGFTVCAECKSADEALKLLPVWKPELLVTDIRMPGMNGLELLGAARDAGFDGECVIVSGYSDFHYAQNALQIGVAGYLLKPVEPAEAAVVLAHVRRKLLEKDANASQRSKAAHHAIAALLSDGGAPGAALPGGMLWGLSTWGAPLPYAIVQALLAQFKPGMATVHIVEDKEYLVLQRSPFDDAPDYTNSIALLHECKRQLTVAGPPAQPENLAGLRKQLADQLDRVCRTALTQHVDALVRAIALRQPDECTALCVELEQFCADCGASAAQRARRQLVSACAGFFKDKETAMQTFLAAQDEAFQTLCLLAIGLLAPAQERVSDAMVRYAAEHQSERVSLNAVAAALKYNATYLGRKFQEEQGLGFREWLTQQRITRGAELLRGTELSVSAVAKAVGYEHYKRFLRHFKQRYGMTPELYRHKKT